MSGFELFQTPQHRTAVLPHKSSIDTMEIGKLGFAGGQ